MKFEHSTHQLLSTTGFIFRMFRWGGVTLLALILSLAVGMIGYHEFESLSWLDSFLNAAMILGGMGAIDTLRTPDGKVFAGLYSLYCGMFLIVCGGVLLVPIFHRVLHHFHADQ